MTDIGVLLPSHLIKMVCGSSSDGPVWHAPRAVQLCARMQEVGENEEGMAAGDEAVVVKVVARPAMCGSVKGLLLLGPGGAAHRRLVVAEVVPISVVAM